MSLSLTCQDPENIQHFIRTMDERKIQHILHHIFFYLFIFSEKLPIVAKNNATRVSQNSELWAKHLNEAETHNRAVKVGQITLEYSF